MDTKRKPEGKIHPEFQFHTQFRFYNLKFLKLLYVNLHNTILLSLLNFSFAVFQIVYYHFYIPHKHINYELKT